MKKYEYKIMKTKPKGFWSSSLEIKELEDEINKLGSDGWEVVSVLGTNIGYGTTNEVVLFLKRESRF